MEAVIGSLSAYEIERGKPMPNLTHGAIQANLIGQFIIHYEELFRIASEVALATVPDGTTPDVVLYGQRDLNFDSEIAKQTEPPLLTIEIQSPSQSPEEMIDKVKQYFQFGVKSAWIVFPALKGVAVYDSPQRYRFFQSDEMLSDSVLDIDIDLKKIFK